MAFVTRYVCTAHSTKLLVCVERACNPGHRAAESAACHAAQALQRKMNIVDQGAWDTTAPSGALMVRTGTQDKVALAREAEEVLTEHTVQRFIKAHDIERGLNHAMFDPECSKTSHARHATGRAIRVVQVPDVIDVDPSIEAL
jgi:hypothetical protein